jgi:membrane protease YdiL (CAAX protease family)
MAPSKRPRFPVVPVWFIAAFVPMIASQVVRLGQATPLAWLLCDWAGRLGALVVLWIVPAARVVAFTPGQRKVGAAEAVLLVILLTGLYLIIDTPLRNLIDTAFPTTKLGHYPASQGLLHGIDMTFGLVLVAYQEELVFRRCARFVLGHWLGDGWGMIAGTAVLFGCYHWWTGPGNMFTATLFGTGAMWVYRRVAVLWPVVLSHYLADLVGFA